MRVRVNPIEPRAWLAPYNRAETLRKYGADVGGPDGRFNSAGAAAQKWMERQLSVCADLNFNTRGKHTHPPIDPAFYRDRTSDPVLSIATVFRNDDGPRDPKYPPSAGETVYQNLCSACRAPDRKGTGMAPPLLGLGRRTNDSDVSALLDRMRNAMPALDATQRRDLLDFLFRRGQPPSRAPAHGDSGYSFRGYQFVEDPDGYPGCTPPWGLLNCLDLNTGKILWRVPLGEYEELTRASLPKTGQQNLGSVTVRASGLVSCAGTPDRRIHAFDSDTGDDLRSAPLPAAARSEDRRAMPMSRLRSRWWRSPPRRVPDDPRWPNRDDAIPGLPRLRGLVEEASLDRIAGDRIRRGRSRDGGLSRSESALLSLSKIPTRHLLCRLLCRSEPRCLCRGSRIFPRPRTCVPSMLSESRFSRPVSRSVFTFSVSPAGQLLSTGVTF